MEIMLNFLLLCGIHWIVEKLNYVLTTKIVDFSINNKQFSSNYFKKSKITILFLLKNPKNNNIILVISI